MPLSKNKILLLDGVVRQSLRRSFFIQDKRKLPEKNPAASSTV